MKQQLKDLALRLKGERKWRFIGLGVLALLAWVMMQNPPPSAPRTDTRPTQMGSSNSIQSKEVVDDLMSRFKSEQDELRKQVQDANKQLQDNQQALQDYEQRTAEIFKKILERMSDQNSGSGGRMPASNPVDAGGADGGNRNMAMNNVDQPIDEPQAPNELEPFGGEAFEPPPPPPPAPVKVAFVGAGDSVRIKLLAGVNAPTDGTPYPVVFKLVGDVNGPDGSALPLGEARLIAAAQGSLVDSRALFRLTSLNLRLPNGQRKVVPVDGWVVGEDGIRGMEGILIDPIGKVIAGSAMANGLHGLGQGIADANSTVTKTKGGLFGPSEETTNVSGDIGEYAAGKALAGASDTYASIIQERFRLMVPQVQVLSGREATAVFAKSLPITDLFEALESEEDSSTVD